MDQNGKPLKHALLDPIQALKPTRSVAEDVGYIPQTTTDDEGKFRIAALLPGLKYSAGVRADVRGLSITYKFLGDAFENVILGKGEVRDLGEIRYDVHSEAASGTRPTP
jgi:hypothetical protein